MKTPGPQKGLGVGGDQLVDLIPHLVIIPATRRFAGWGVVCCRIGVAMGHNQGLHPGLPRAAFRQALLSNNIFDSVACGQYPFPKRKRKKPVTLLAGIICSDGIVLASDSQTTFGQSKTCRTNKISAISFGNREVLIAESGVASFSNAAIEKIWRKAETANIVADDSILEVVTAAVREVRQDQMSMYPRKKPSASCYSLTEWQEHFFKEENNFELMVAYYFQGKPYLRKISAAVPVPNPPGSFIMTSGCGQELGWYILDEYASLNMEASFACVVATYAVEEVCKTNIYCSPPTNVAAIQQIWAGFVRDDKESRESYIHIFSGKEVENIVNNIAKIEPRIKEQRTNKIKAFLNKLSQKEVASYLAKLRELSKGSRYNPTEDKS